MVLMKKTLNALWRRLSGGESRDRAELTHIAFAQQEALRRRAEYAAAQEQESATAAAAAQTGPVPRQSSLSSSRRKVEAAESAYTAALQRWENRQARQKSR
jgi:hypothetical protein